MITRVHTHMYNQRAKWEVSGKTMRRDMFGWSAGSFVIGNTGLAHLHTCNMIMILVMVNWDLMCTEQDSNEQSF